MINRFTSDPTHSRIGFSAKHLAVATVRGHFAKFDGWMEADLDNPVGARGEATIEVASITTGVEQRDAHLRSADFFDAEKYPEIKFVLTGVEKVDDDTYNVTGDMTIKETTLPVTFEAVVEGRTANPFGEGERVGIAATAKINRMDFGLNWDGLAGAIPMASHTIKIELDVELVSAPLNAGVAS